MQQQSTSHRMIERRVNEAPIIGLEETLAFVEEHLRIAEKAVEAELSRWDGSLIGDQVDREQVAETLSGQNTGS